MIFDLFPVGATTAYRVFRFVAARPDSFMSYISTRNWEPSVMSPKHFHRQKGDLAITVFPFHAHATMSSIFEPRAHRLHLPVFLHHSSLVPWRPSLELLVVVSNDQRLKTLTIVCFPLFVCYWVSIVLILRIHTAVRYAHCSSAFFPLFHSIKGFFWLLHCALYSKYTELLSDEITGQKKWIYWIIYY